MCEIDTVQLDASGAVIIAGKNSGYRWRNNRGQLEMLDQKRIHRVSHPDRRSFCVKVLEFDNKIGEFA